MCELFQPPEWLRQDNWVEVETTGRRGFFETMLQLVHAKDQTGSHFDNNACDTWMKLLAGQVLVATWSFEDAKEHGMDAGWEVPSALLHDTAHAPAWCLPRLSSLLLTTEHGRSSLEARLRPPQT